MKKWSKQQLQQQEQLKCKLLYTKYTQLLTINKHTTTNILTLQSNNIYAIIAAIKLNILIEQKVHELWCW